MEKKLYWYVLIDRRDNSNRLTLYTGTMKKITLYLLDYTSGQLEVFAIKF